METQKRTQHKDLDKNVVMIAQNFTKKFSEFVGFDIPCKVDIKNAVEKIMELENNTWHEVLVFNFCKKYRTEHSNASLVKCLNSYIESKGTKVEKKDTVKKDTPKVEVKEIVKEIKETVKEVKKDDVKMDKTNKANQLISVLNDVISSSNNVDKDQLIAELLPVIEKTVKEENKAINEELDNVKAKLDSINKTVTKDIVYNIDINGIKSQVKDRILHSEFFKVLKTCQLPKGFDKDLGIQTNYIPYLGGEAGTGKTQIASDVAKQLKMDFYYDTTVIQDFKLTGFVDAKGDYHPTPLYNAMKKGGLYFIDEIDASTTEVLIILNGLFSNGYMVFANGETLYLDGKKTPMIVAGNTFGFGASEQYQGRSVIDGATRNRFVNIYIDYDKDIELLCANGDSDFVEFTHDLRKASKNTGNPCIFSYRNIKAYFDLLKIDEGEDFALYNGFFALLPKDNLRTLLDACNNKENKYLIKSLALLRKNSLFHD